MTEAAGGQTLTPVATQGPPAVHVARFTASPVGPVTILTFFAFAANEFGASPGLTPAFSAALTAGDLLDLRELLNRTLTALQTLSADETKPQ
jgi:hypothetical protein